MPDDVFDAYLFRDRDVFQDVSSRIFMTIGYIQPPVRVISFLKYIPDEHGQWHTNVGRYRRVFSGGVSSVVKGMCMIPRNYLIYDNHFGVVLSEVPYSNIITRFVPEERLNEILKYGPVDSLEEKVVLVANALHDHLRLDFSHIGVTGSISWYGHNPSFSDVNINVYGFKNSWLVHNEFDLLANHHSLQLCTISDWQQSITRLSSRIPSLDDQAILDLFNRRLALCLNKLRIAITPVLSPSEVPIRYGSEVYTVVTPHPISVQVTIDDDSYGIFLPALFTCHSKPLRIIDNESISRIMVYDGVFRGLIRQGDLVEVVGTLQKVTFTETPDRHEYQLMVGTQNGAGCEYIRLL